MRDEGSQPPSSTRSRRRHIPCRPPTGFIHFNSLTGQFANLIAVTGDPLEVKILENVQFVLKGGTVVKSELLK